MQSLSVCALPLSKCVSYCITIIRIYIYTCRAIYKGLLIILSVVYNNNKAITALQCETFSNRRAAVVVMVMNDSMSRTNFCMGYKL